MPDLAIEDLTNEQQATFRSEIGLGNVNNTSDANKPVSTATHAAIQAATPRRIVTASDAKIIEDLVITSGSAIVTSATANFTSADVGKTISVVDGLGSGSRH